MFTIYNNNNNYVLAQLIQINSRCTSNYPLTYIASGRKLSQSIREGEKGTLVQFIWKAESVAPACSVCTRGKGAWFIGVTTTISHPNQKAQNLLHIPRVSKWK